MDSLVGLSDNTDGVNVPINGLRHPSEGKTSGWYIWSGEKFSKGKDFFKPVHEPVPKSSNPKSLKAES